MDFCSPSASGSITYVSATKQTDPGGKVLMRVSYLQIYCEVLQDLLLPDELIERLRAEAPSHHLVVFGAPRGSVFVFGRRHAPSMPDRAPPRKMLATLPGAPPTARVFRP